jgi:hypothetical protein
MLNSLNNKRNVKKELKMHGLEGITDLNWSNLAFGALSAAASKFASICGSAVVEGTAALFIAATGPAAPAMQAAIPIFGKVVGFTASFFTEKGMEAARGAGEIAMQTFAKQFLTMNF